MKATGTQAAGFTLLELLVIVVVVGFLIAGLAQALHFGLRAFDRQSRTASAIGDLDSTDRTLRLLIEHMEPATSEAGEPQAAGSAHIFGFVTELPAAMGALASRGAYVLLRVDGQHRLALQWTARPHATRIGPPPLSSDEILLDQVDQLDLAYLVTRQSGPAWVTDWKSATPPRLIRLRIVFAPDGPHTWPDIIIAPIAARGS